MAQKKATQSEPENLTSPEIKKIIENITKEYGEGIITTLGESKFKDQPTLSTGSIILDHETGGGYPLGRIVEIYGENSSGKTTLALHANIGVDIDGLLVLRPRHGEEAFKLVTDFIRGGAGLIVIDSIAPLIPIELLGNWERPPIGAHAKMLNNGLRQINHEMTNRETIIIFINQIRYKIPTGFTFGNPETTTGGASLPYYAILKRRAIPSQISSKDKKKPTDIELMFEGEKKLGQGKENVTEYLLENPELYQKIKEEVFETINADK
ncbi:18027_t:CDS:2 [Funneliformis geosporum]|uniref:975_t:CDS:1 n=1 Tax=Funneliformis geosporum TaxID=1117311 RepID=A0A9W4SXV0_9GLOM|nr:18027_t:CDS:2 [Funneliformis geosporum]CAI2187517.1 975_t:CDS:2 [Funneliformis geosporum]